MFRRRYLSRNSSIFKNLEKLLLICGLNLNEINYSKLSQFEVILSEEGSKLGDDILTLRYISKLANEMGLFVIIQMMLILKV